VNWKTQRQPGHAHGIDSISGLREALTNAGGPGTTDHSVLTNRDLDDQHPISSITGLQTSLDTKVVQGYGGILLDAPTVIADLNGTSWVTLPANAASVSSPIDVGQDFATNSISIDSEGVWLVVLSGTLSHNEVNAGRTMGVRVHNVDKVTSPHVVGVPTGRNAPGTDFSYSFLVEITGANVTDNFTVDIGGPGDTYTNLQVTEYSFDAVHVSGDGAGGSSPSDPSGGKSLIEEITDPVTGAFRFITIPQTFKTLVLELEGRSDEVALNTPMRGFVNGDTTDANYFFQNSFGRDGGGIFSSGNIANAGRVPGASAPANSYSRHEITFQNYTSAYLKIMSTEFTSYFAGADGMDTGHIGTIALNVSAAINEIELRTDSFGVHNLMGTARLYGVN